VLLVVLVDKDGVLVVVVVVVEEVSATISGAMVRPFTSTVIVLVAIADST